MVLLRYQETSTPFCGAMANSRVIIGFIISKLAPSCQYKFVRMPLNYFWLRKGRWDTGDMEPPGDDTNT